MCSYLSESNFIFSIQKEIYCLEETLKKRNLELQDVEHTIKMSKKELMSLKAFKIRVSFDNDLN